MAQVRVMGVRGVGTGTGDASEAWVAQVRVMRVKGVGTGGGDASEARVA